MPRDVTARPTPNPNAYRFGLGGDVFGTTSRSFPTADSAAGTPWAEALHGIEGVASLFAVRDFVTVTKESGAQWKTVVPQVVEVLAVADL